VFIKKNLKISLGTDDDEEDKDERVEEKEE